VRSEAAFLKTHGLWLSLSRAVSRAAGYGWNVGKSRWSWEYFMQL